MVNTVKFKEVLKIIAIILKENGTIIDEERYDGLIIKELTETDFYIENRIDSDTNQTHIAIRKKQKDIFPYIKSYGYFNKEHSDSSLKKYFFIRVPISLAPSNIYYLDKKGNEKMSIDIDDPLIHSFTSIYCGQSNGKFDRMQMGLETKDGAMFKHFRNLLFEEDHPYLFILKIKEKYAYEAFAVLNKDIPSDYDLSDYNDDFFKLKTETPIDPDEICDLHYLDFVDRECGGENLLFYGVPGSGKSRMIENDYCGDGTITERILFHPDYTYSDFVGQILPKVTEKEQIKYEFIPGPFTSILKKAYTNPKKKFVLIIEEINRGNAPAIFGDIFQLLDRKTEFKEKEKDDGYPLGTSEYGIINSDIADIVYGDKEHEVRIPCNLSIIASMNTSDQNVFTLDNAFQRRWEMKLIENSFDNVDREFYSKKVLGSNVEWKHFCTTINDEILEKNKLSMSSEDKRLGVYFVNSEELDDDRKFSEKVIKYLWDDAFKFNRDEIFNEGYNSLEYIIKDLEKDDFDKLSIFTKELQVKLNKKEETKSQNLKEEQAEDNDSE